MRRALRYGALVVGVLLAGCVAALGFGAVARARIALAAESSHLDVTVGKVRVGWLAIRLLDVGIRLHGADAVAVHLDEVRVDGVSRRHVVARGGQVTVAGTPGEVREAFAQWQAERRPRSVTSGESKGSTDIDAEGLSVSWTDQRSQTPRIFADGVAFAFDGRTAHVDVGSARVRLGTGVLAVNQAVGVVNSSGDVLEGHAATASLELAVPAPLAPPSSTATSPEAARRADRHAASQNSYTSLVRVSGDVPAATPLLRLPDLRRLWALGAAVGQRSGQQIPVGTALRVDAFTWKVAPAVGVPLTVGPGPLTLARSAAALELQFSTGHDSGGAPLSLEAILGISDGEDVLSLEGGPIALSVLGLREGAAGLVDVAHTTISGRGRVVLGDGGATMTFSAEGGISGMSISDPRIAPELVRGLGLSFHAHGATTADGGLRVDDFGAAMGSARVEGGGHLQQHDDGVVGLVHFDVPSTSCPGLMASVPDALMPALQGVDVTGIFAAHGQVEFDTRALDQLALDYEVHDQCRVVRVPSQLARSRFEHPFVHQVYQPDGSIEDATTGPGTEAWTPLVDISPYMQVAVMTTEDAAFFSHHGFNRASIRSAIIANLKARRFVRGASTITMQLAKNLFLVRDKTISRKLEEVFLTDYLEQTFSKDELMELYLNVIEFGPSVYGVGAAADYYFGRTPAELNLSECLFLASLLPAPVRYGAMRDAGQVPEGWMRMIHGLLSTAHRNGRITDVELAEAQKESIVFWPGGDRPTPRPPVRARPGLDGPTGDDTTAAPAAEPPDGP